MERLERINSVYLHKDRTRLGYGLFITDDRIVGLRGSRLYWLVTILHTMVVPSGSILGIFYPPFGEGLGPLLLLLALFIVELAWIGIDWLLVVPAIDRIFRGRDFSIDELEERKDFEARRSVVWEIEVKQGKDAFSGAGRVQAQIGSRVQPSNLVDEE
ncbi:MAG TPA: hypothetical protein VGS11_07290 [Candidatus Bathyarchaeia archaeon]|nr:hypothetical protein [Candidatus Bathyarchaeia archaeon]